MKKIQRIFSKTSFLFLLQGVLQKGLQALIIASLLLNPLTLRAMDYGAIESTTATPGGIRRVAPGLHDELNPASKPLIKVGDEDDDSRTNVQSTLANTTGEASAAASGGSSLSLVERGDRDPTASPHSMTSSLLGEKETRACFSRRIDQCLQGLKDSCTSCRISCSKWWCENRCISCIRAKPYIFILICAGVLISLSLIALGIVSEECECDSWYCKRPASTPGEIRCFHDYK